MNYLTPELPVSNIDDALAALTAGIRTAWRLRDNFACMFGGNIEIFLRRVSDPKPVTLYIKVDDADSFYQALPNARRVGKTDSKHALGCASSHARAGQTYPELAMANRVEAIDARPRRVGTAGAAGPAAPSSLGNELAIGAFDLPYQNRDRTTQRHSVTLNHYIGVARLLSGSYGQPCDAVG
jgi:hypothetical protein